MFIKDRENLRYNSKC